MPPPASRPPVPKARVDQIGLIGQIQELAAAKVAIGMFTGRLEQTTPVAVEGERQQTKLATTRLNRIIMEPWRRWANGFSCLCFVLVGAPMESGCATPTSSPASFSASCRS